jgi:cytochrome bd-type quinol oxidase subunit 1
MQVTTSGVIRIKASISGRPQYRELARKWTKATGLSFALGADSGTALNERT